jgi:hypothetical protein
MRFAARSLVCVLVLGTGSHTLAAEAGPSWWPFSHKQEATVSQPSGVVASTSPKLNPAQTAPGPVSHEVQLPPSADSAAAAKSKSWLHMPSLPKLGSSTKTKKETTKNKWVQKAPAAPTSSGAVQAMKNGANKVTSGTKSAWNKTVTTLTPGTKSKQASSTSPRIAQNDKPPLWKRMLGEKESDLKQPQTVPQWMAQKRLDP